jgi:ribosomal protein L11 methylase PrmA
MRKTGRCILSAVIAVLLMIGAIDYAFVIGKAKPVGDLKTSQSEVIVKDFIHDNYEISEKNPWTDYGLHPIEYTESAGKSGFDKAISAKAAILVNVNSKEIYYEKNSDELVIELDPGRAFGTGTHPTTYLCIRLMEKYIENSHTVIDVGTGSGILMVAANKLGAKEIWGVDIDADACEVAKENLILNGITDENTKVLVGNLLNVVENKTFDVVVANILADVILMLLKDISKVIKKDGILILSGIIEDKKNLVINACEKEGLELVEVQEDKEWVALSLRMK